MSIDGILRRALARSLLLGALAAALGACVSSAGIEHQGALKALPAGPAETAPTVWPTDRWWLAYGAPELDQLIDHALADSPDIERARARLRLAQAGSEFATARSFPEVDLNFKSTIQRYADHGLAPRAVAGEHRSDNRFALDFTYELDLFGKNAAIAKSVEVQAASMETDLYTARVGLASAVARSWFALGEALAAREVIDATLAQRQRILALVRARVAEGLDSKVEERQAEGAIPAAVGELAAVDERIALLRSVLAKLAVVPLETTAKLKPALKGAGLASLPPLLPSGLIARRPEIVAARQRVESLGYATDAARAEFYPSVNLVAFAGFSALGLDALLQEGSQVYGLGPAVRLPIFDAGRLRARLKFVNAQLDLAIADYNGALLAALQDVVHSVVSIRALAERQAAQREAAAAAESAYDLALQRFQAGLTGYLTVLATESEVLEARRAGVLLAARACELDVDLKRALGGGFEAPVTVAQHAQD